MQVVEVIFKVQVHSLVVLVVQPVHHHINSHHQDQEHHNILHRQHQVVLQRLDLDHHKIQDSLDRHRIILDNLTMDLVLVHLDHLVAVHRNLLVDPARLGHRLFHLVVIHIIHHLDNRLVDHNMVCHRVVPLDLVDIRWEDQWDQDIQQ